MILNKSLLLKCLGGVAACFGTAGVGILGSQSGLWNNQSPREEPKDPPAAVTNDQTITELSTLIAKVGLTTCTSTESGSNECTIGESGLNVKQGENKKEKNKKTDSSQTPGKIKVSKDSNTSSYNQGFKFVIEGGDITLTGDGSSITKLEQFETYEIKEENSGTDWYFSRVKEAKDGIKTALGLPDGCSLPDNDSSTCDIESGKINEINFDGKNNTATVTGTVTLTITKLTTPEEDFPFDYKFSFKGKEKNETLTLSSSKTISLDSTNGTEFRIKKPATGNTITLEEAWSLNRLLEKVGLQCNGGSNDECTQKSGKTTNIKLDTTLDGKSLTTSGSGSGKIKLYKKVSGYNKGFKFVIEEGDIKLTGGTGSTITKLEEFETYEIKEESGKWYFSRKDKAGKKIKELLGLPSDCTLVDALNCTDKEISSSNINSLKFDGESSTPSIGGTATLTVTKEDSNTEFPFGYKFGFKGKDSNATLTINSKTITLKTSEATEFKIKKISDNKLTLAQVWTLETLAKKVNLTCTDNTCTQISGQTTNIKQENELENKTIPASGSDSGSGKIKVYTTDTDGYNKGFKFVIEGGDITIENTTKLEEFETYEIKEESNKWYFYRKDKAEKGIKKALGLDGIDDCNFPTTNNTPTTCTLNTDKLKKINFDGKGTNDPTIADSGTPTLKISITSGQEKNQFPFGYKFTLESDKEITLNTEDSKSIKANTNTEFKIKATAAENGSGARTLSLEKAWNAKSLGEKVGLSCPDSTSDKKCDFTEGSINVNNGSDNSKITNGKFKNSSEATGKKMTYEEDQGDYNQGIRFYLEGENDIALTNEENGSTDGESNKKIEKKSNSGGSEVYYEIKKDGETWYLTKHTNSQ